ncbi:MAG: thioredoxin family protein [Candidatus Thorarchaeota archaeon]
MTEIAEWNDAITYEKFLETARENVELMKARYNDFLLNEEDEAELNGIQNQINILVIGNDHCNDTAGNLPVLAKMASCSANVEVRILDSDKHARFHQKFRVNGKRKTPVILFLSQELNELARWVERPNSVYQLVNEKNLSLDDRRAMLRQLYSDPEILRQSFNELMMHLIRADLVLGRK